MVSLNIIFVRKYNKTEKEWPKNDTELISSLTSAVQVMFLSLSHNAELAHTEVCVCIST